MKWLILAFPVAVWFLLPHPANAQPQCGDWQKLSDTLRNEHGEHFVAGWLMSEDVILQFWASDEARTWTILRVSTDGTACITSYGQDWILGIPDTPGEDL